MAFTVNADTVQKFYIAYYGRPADPAGRNYWLADTAGTASAWIENFGNQTESTNLYTDMSTEERVNSIYQQLFDREAEFAGLMYWTGQIKNGTVSLAKAAYAIMLGAQNTAEFGNDSDAVDNKLSAANSFTAAINTTSEAEAYSTINTNSTIRDSARAWLATVDDTAASVTAAAATMDSTISSIVTGSVPAPPAPTNETFTLTAGVDAGSLFIGGAGNDTFNALATGTFNALDSLDGGDGTDTLSVADNAAAVATTSRVVTDIEIANLSSSASVNANTTGWTGLETLNVVSTATAAETITAASTTSVSVSNSTAFQVNVVGGGGTLFVSNAGAAVDVNKTTDAASAFTSATVTGTATTVDIIDTTNSTGTVGSTLTTVSLTGNTGAATLTGKGITNVSITDGVAASDVTITNAATGGHTQTLTLDNNAATLVITDATATTVNVATTGDASSVALAVAAATTINVSGDQDLTLENTGAVYTVLTAINNTSTGDVEVESALGTGVTYTGSDAGDMITLGATTKAITTGGGDDKVTLSAAVTALGLGGSIDAGGGSADTLAFADGDDAGTASAATTFETSISGFERVELAGAAGAGVALNLANLDDISYVKLSANLAQALTITKMGAAGTLAATITQTGATSVALATATGLTDVVNVSLASAVAVNSGALTIAGVETINYLTDDTAATSIGIEHLSNLTATAAKTITITGDAGLTLTNTDTTVTSFDASAVTDGDVTWVTGILAAANTIKGGATADANIINWTASIAGATTYTGGSQTDTIVFANAMDNVLTLGNGTNTVNTGVAGGTGDNTITGGTGSDTVKLLSGDNTVDLGNGTNVFEATTGNNTYTGGTGADTVVVTTGANTIHLGGGTTANSVTVGASAGLTVIDTTSSGVDTLVLSAIQTAAGYYTSLTGWAAGDKIDVSAMMAAASAVTPLGAKMPSLGGAASFANYLDAACAGDGDVAAIIKWFQYSDGNTYIVVDNGTGVDTATFEGGIDSVIQLAGLVNLATSTVALDVITLV